MYMKQKLRFENFLKDYVRDLSFGTTNIKKLVAECEDFPKLREPLLLYAKFNGKLKLLYSVLEKTPNGELQHLCDTYGSTLTIEQLEQQDENLPERLRRVWTSYVAVRDSAEADNYMKGLMRKKVLSLLAEKHVTVYRVCKDTGINRGRLYRWLNKENMSAISCRGVDKVLRYLVDILPTAKAGGFLHQPPLHSNRGCCVLHDVRQALLPVCPTVR